MFNFTKKIAAVLLLVFIAVNAQAQKIMGYVESYRYSNITTQEYAALTDVLYSFLNFDTQGNIKTTYDSDATFGWDPTAFTTVKGKCKVKNVSNSSGPKLHIAVGGADKPELRSARFSTVCANSTYRAKLVSGLVSFATSNGLYGISIDWEFPKTTADKNNHQALISELKTAIAASSDPSLILSIAVGGEYKGSVNHMQYINSATLGYADEIHLMTYDLPTSYSSNHSTIADAKGCLDQWKLTYNVPYNKMLMGIPFYGWDANRVNTKNYADETSYTTAYNKTDEGIVNSYYYNSKDAIDKKIEYTYLKGGAGIIIWAIGQDRQLPDAYSLLGACSTATATKCQAPQPDLGTDIGVCLATNPSGSTLDSKVAAQSGRTFVWKQGTTTLSNTNPTLTNVNTAGVYSVTVTQGGCSRTSTVNVTVSSTKTSSTNGSVCGSGTVSLTASGGTNYVWYDAAVGGSQVGTGQTITTPTVSATDTFYVQDAGTSVSYDAGKAAIETPKANLSLFDRTYLHKLVVAQQMKITSVDLVLAPNCKDSIEFRVISSVDNKAVSYKVGPFYYSNTSTSSPMTVTVPLNLSLPAGTYYAGFYAHDYTAGANITANTAQVNRYKKMKFWNEVIGWSETNLLPDYSVSGVVNISGNTFDDFLDGLGVRTPASAVYGSAIFNWKVTVGALNACGRGMGIVTVTPGANTALTVDAITPAVCLSSSNNGTIVVKSSESGITYQAKIGSTTVGTSTPGTGSDLNITIPGSALVTVGQSSAVASISVTATKNGCGASDLADTATIKLKLAPAAPGAITFTSPVCANAQSQAVSVAAVATATSYNWSYSGAGATFAGTTAATTVSFNGSTSTAGNITVTATNECGTSAASAAKAVTLTPLLATPTNIVLPNPICAGANNLSLSVGTVPNAAGYSWSYSGTGITFSNSSPTPTINVASNATPGNITVSATGQCGGSLASAPVAVTISTVPATPVFATGSTQLTQGTNGNAYSINAVNGATSYTWSYNPSAGVTVNPNGTSATINVAANATTGSGYVSVTANNACGSSTAGIKQTSIVTGIDNGLVEAGATVAPNPTSNSFTLSVASTSSIQLGVYNAIGVEVESVSVNADHVTMGNSLPAGVYFVKGAINGKSVNFKVVKH